MKNKTATAFALGALCAGVGVYIYMKNKEQLGKCEVFSQDFYDDVKDGVIEENNTFNSSEDFVI